MICPFCRWLFAEAERKERERGYPLPNPLERLLAQRFLKSKPRKAARKHK